ncbi:ATP-binding protein [Streptomyces sp. ME08-AFT2]|uniref:ATP-binding protein n=1 Tax=Streptomyces sp. ME08-AFT2 TaxID=3028683 RepID=UPI0029A93C90|nr:ATP-binding protein [Streptomyces sp. ME08-AFT2]MDX3314016.1 ATP-binding protein [Streptomyces sp. ME08-AFT2]
MDPNTRGPEEHGHDQGDLSRSSAFDSGPGQTSRPRPSRDPLTPDFGQSAPALARTVRLVAGDHLLTVNPVDGSEIEPCPPAGTARSSAAESGGERPGRPARRTPEGRAEAERAARPPAPAGTVPPAQPLLGRQDEREQLVRLLARGRSVRLTGAPGSGRTSLLDLVAEDCEDLAPDGVVRLSGRLRTTADLLHDLFHAVYDAPRHRPDEDELRDLVREIGAVVVVDDLDLGGADLDELLDATPECAFLLAATPDTPPPSVDSAVEEVVLSGLDRAGGVEVIERAVSRVLTEEEANWAGDLWFESEGLPLRFVQAGALLAQRDRLRAGADAVDAFGVFEDVRPLPGPVDAAAGAGEAEGIPLPSLGEAAAPAPLLATRLSASARATLRLAVALGGEVPHQAHLPALVGDTHADAALGELAGCGLVSPVGTRYRLAAGVQTQLEAAGYADDVETRARAAAQHYAWWTGHPSVTPERVCAEADAVLAALAAVVADTTRPEEGEEATAVRLARTAAPAFAAGLQWSAWSSALHEGAEAARLAAQSADRAYFHHELGVLALCTGDLDRARSELEASLALRGTIADKRGTVAGRRALALVADRSGDVPGLPVATSGDETPDVRREEQASPPHGVRAAHPAFPPHGVQAAAHPASPPEAETLVARREPPAAATRHSRGGLRSLARRNLVGVGAGALLVAVLGTVVTLGATSNKDAGDPSDRVGVNPSVSTGVDGGDLGADLPGDDKGSADTGEATSRPTDPGPDGTMGTSDDPTPTESATPSAGASSSEDPGDGKPSGSPKPPPSPSSTAKPPSGTPTGPTGQPSDTPSGTPTGSTPSDTPSGTPSDDTSVSGGNSMSSAPVGGTMSSPGLVGPSDTEPGSPDEVI